MRAKVEGFEFEGLGEVCMGDAYDLGSNSGGTSSEESNAGGRRLCDAVATLIVSRRRGPGYVSDHKMCPMMASL